MSKIRPKECQNVEYKRSWQDEYLKWICGFANAQGAVMYFGVDDDHEVVGLKNVDKLMEDIPNKVVNFLGIVVDVDLHEQDGLEYIELTVASSNVPISYKGKYYYRSGSTMQELNGAALQQFILRKMGRSWDDITNEYATLDDIDREAIDFFLQSGLRNGRVNEKEMNAPTQTVLENLDLIGMDGKLKNAALLLFGKRPQRFFTCVQFKIGRFGHSEADLIIQDVIEGNVIQMADRVMEVLKSKYLTMPIRFEGMNRIEKLEVPEEALREILYNAIAHKLYSGAPIQMRVWDDYAEVWNEGELPPGYTPETLLGQHSSRPRNKNIANAFFKAGFIDAWGRGYKKIREGFESAGLSMPKIESVFGGVRVTIQRNNKGNSSKNMETGNTNNYENQDTTEKTTEKTTKKTTEKTTEKIIKAIRNNPYVTTKELAEIIGISEDGIYWNTKNLKSKGIIRRVGSDKGGHWEIIEQ